jgi:Icc protein
MMIASSEAFWAIIKQHPQTKAVINGHIHQEQDGTIGEVRVLGTPSTCFQFKPDSKDFGLDNKSPAYRHLSLYADGSLTTEVCYLPEALIGLNHDSDGY